MSGTGAENKPKISLIRRFLESHKSSLRRFGIFILVGTFIVKTEIRDHVKSVLDRINFAEVEISDHEGTKYVLQGIGVLAISAAHVDDHLDKTRGSLRIPGDQFSVAKTAVDAEDQSSKEAMEMTITDYWALSDALPLGKNQRNKELLAYRNKANSLGRGDQSSAWNGLDLGTSLRMFCDDLSHQAALESMYLDRVYRIADVTSLILYAVGGLLAFAGKVYGIEGLSL